MTNYYLSAQLSRYVDEQGGRDFLAALVEKEMATPSAAEPVSVAPPAAFCEHCGIRLQIPGARTCFGCGLPQS